MNGIKNGALFALGGGAYVGLELLYRGRSHISMFAAGGLSFLLLGKLGRKELAFPAKIFLGTAAITAVELGTGLLVNRDHSVWDYRDKPYNFRGQICPQFIALWIPLSMLGMDMHNRLDGLWDRLTE